MIQIERLRSPGRGRPSQPSACEPMPEAGTSPTDPALPYGFARRNGVILQRDGEGPVCSCRAGASVEAMIEVQRLVGGAASFETLEAAGFETALRASTATTPAKPPTSPPPTATSRPWPTAPRRSTTCSTARRLAGHPPDQRAAARGVKEGASDIHVETQEKRLVVRFRVDGVLRDMLEPKRALAPLLVSRIKVMARARHRREAPAAGRPRHAADRRARRRRARLDDSDPARRARGDAPARSRIASARPRQRSG